MVDLSGSWTLVDDTGDWRCDMALLESRHLALRPAGRIADSGHPATLSFTPATPGTRPTFTLRDLHSATYGH